jgi:hypothetical protein
MEEGLKCCKSLTEFLFKFKIKKIQFKSKISYTNEHLFSLEMKHINQSECIKQMKIFCELIHEYESDNESTHDFGGEMPQKWENNIKIDHRKMSCEAGGWMELAQDCVQ